MCKGRCERGNVSFVVVVVFFSSGHCLVVVGKFGCGSSVVDDMLNERR